MLAPHPQGSEVNFLLQTRPFEDCINAFDFTTHTHTLGSNSLGPSVVELITFAALTWNVIVLIVILTAISWYLDRGKQSIKDLDLEFYSQATWEGLVLVPALDTVFSLGWCAPLDTVFSLGWCAPLDTVFSLGWCAPFGCKQECIISIDIGSFFKWGGTDLGCKKASSHRR